MIIGFDLDDTICETFDFILPYCCKYYSLDYEDEKKKNHPFEYYVEKYGYYDFAKKYYEKIMPFVPLKKDVVKYLEKIKKRGHKIILITARSSNGFNNPYQLTYDYLVKNNIPFDTLIIEANDKDKICIDEEVELFFDNSVSNCTKVCNNNIKTYLVEDNFNKKNKDFKKVKNIKDIYKVIKKEERNARRKSRN